MNRIHFVLVLFFFSIFTSGDFNSAVLFSPVFLLAAIRLHYVKDEIFTIHDMFWLCIVIFFGVAPMQTLEAGFFVESGTTRGLFYRQDELVEAIFIVYTFLVLFLLGELCFFLKMSDAVSDSSIRFITSQGIFFIFSIFIISAILFTISSGGFENVTRPRLEKVAEDTSFISALFLALCVASTIFITLDVLNNKLRRFFTYPMLGFCYLILMLFVNFTNSPRFFIVASWFPIILVYLNRKLKFSYCYLVLIFSILFIMPVMSITTRSGLQDVNLDDIFSAGIFKIKDVDIFETLVHTIGHVKTHGLAFGDNLLAILLFFVPRAVWPEKPIVGGLVIGEDLFWGGVTGTPNLSYFIAGDAYMDFGLIGTAVIALLIGYFYSMFSTKSVALYGHNLVIYCFISSLPILLRGPVGAVIGYPLCLIFSIHLFKFIATKEYENITHST